MSRFVIWLPEYKWPELDPSGFVFLGRAFDEIGAAMFPADWTGREWRSVGGAEPSHTKRALAVRDEITRRAEAGELATALKASNGSMVDAPRRLWNRGNLDEPFALGTMTLPGHPLAGDGLIFVERESLDRLLLQMGSTKAEESILPDHLSPYLRCMLIVAKKLRINPDNQLKKEVVAAELRTAWKQMHGSEPEATDLNWMATLIREPGSKAGRGAKKRQAPNK
jgi:hypothetical protein